MDTFLEKLESRIAVLRTELAELETALRVYLRISPNGTAKGKTSRHKAAETSTAGESDNSSSNSLKGTTVVGAAKATLAGSPEPLHYKVVCERAVANGYVSPRGPAKASTFVALTKRNPDIFEAVGNGTYKLKA